MQGYVQDAGFVRSLGIIAQRKQIIDEGDPTPITDKIDRGSVESIIDYDVYNNINYGQSGGDEAQNSSDAADVIVKGFGQDSINILFDSIGGLFDDAYEQDEAFQTVLLQGIKGIHDVLQRMDKSYSQTASKFQRFRVAWQYAQDHPVLTAVSISKQLVGGTYRNIFRPLLFGFRKRDDGILKVNNSVQELIELERTGQIDRRNSFMDNLKSRGIVGSIGHLALRGMGITQATAQQREDERAQSGEVRTGGQDQSFLNRTRQKLSEKFYGGQIIRRDMTQAGTGLSAQLNRDVRQSTEDYRKNSLNLLQNIYGILGGNPDTNISQSLITLNELTEEGQETRKQQLKEAIKQKIGRWLSTGVGMLGSMLSSLSSIAGGLFSGVGNLLSGLVISLGGWLMAKMGIKKLLGRSSPKGTNGRPPVIGGSPTVTPTNGRRTTVPTGSGGISSAGSNIRGTSLAQVGGKQMGLVVAGSILLRKFKLDKLVPHISKISPMIQNATKSGITSTKNMLNQMKPMMSGAAISQAIQKAKQLTSIKPSALISGSAGGQQVQTGGARQIANKTSRQQVTPSTISQSISGQKTQTGAVGQAASSGAGSGILSKLIKGATKLLSWGGGPLGQALISQLFALPSQFDEHAVERYQMRAGLDPSSVQNMTAGKKLGLRTGGLISDSLDEASFGLLGKTYQDGNFDRDYIDNPDSYINRGNRAISGEVNQKIVAPSQKNSGSVTKKMDDGRDLKEFGDKIHTNITELTKNMKDNMSGDITQVELSKQSSKKIDDLSKSVESLSRSVQNMSRQQMNQARSTTSDIMQQAGV